MKRKKTIVLASIIFIQSLTVILSYAEQDKRIRRTANPFRKDIPSFKDNVYSRDSQQQYAPREILVKFRPTLSDFDADYLIGDYLYKRFGRLDPNWRIIRKSANNLYRIRFPENFSVEQTIKIFEQNPYVEYAEPNYISFITAIPETQRAQVMNFLKKLRSIETNTPRKPEEKARVWVSNRHPE